jgi:hypothetical protein
MTLVEFAEQYRVRTRQDECGETIIPGKLWKVRPKSNFASPNRLWQYGHQIYEHGKGQFGLLLMFPVDNDKEIGGSGKSAKWVNAQKRLIAAGFTIRQNGDAEGTALFNPDDNAQARFALKLAGIKTRRQLSPERRASLASQLEVARAKKAA